MHLILSIQFNPITDLHHQNLRKNGLIDLTQTVIDHGGIGVVYWEPSWVSTTCWNQWNQGSHQDHATFFDFENHLLQPGGIDFMSYDYQFSTSTEDITEEEKIFLTHVGSRLFEIKQDLFTNQEKTLEVIDTVGRVVFQLTNLRQQRIDLSSLIPGNYIAVLSNESTRIRYTQKLVLP